MQILKALSDQSRYFYAYVFLLGMINSIVYFTLIMFINNAVKGTSMPFLKGYDGWIFLLLVATSLICTKIFQTYLVKLTHGILFSFELSILQKLRFAKFQDFENLGANRIYTAISDVRILAYIPEVFVVVIDSSVIILCALGYLLWVSPWGGLAVLGLAGGLVLIYLIRNKRIERDLNRVRDLQNDYHKYLRDLLYGFKEIKMSINRNENIYNGFLKSNRTEGRTLGVRSAVKYLDNELLGTYSWYIALGIAIFVLPNLLGLQGPENIPFIIIILYLMGPLASLVKIIPLYTNVKIALERIEEVKTDIDETGTNEQELTARLAITEPFSSLKFEEVVFQYTNNKNQQTFSAGPFSITIEKGSVVFITGGNGSGKSTFINLLTGLYQPLSGRIYWNGKLIEAEQYPYYSNLFSAIFTTAHLFSENYDGFDLREENPELKELINLMQMSAVIKRGTRKNFIDTGLSKGQQKRLALIYAIMEHRDILVLDEWAAEQDPHFRAYFYKILIPELKGRGKTIIAVTHDDAYFNCADRILKFDYGKIIEDRALMFEEDTLVSLNTTKTHG